MPNAGKTTIAYELMQDKLRHCVLIDGDKFREHITPELNFSKDDIINNNLKCMKLCNFLNEQGYNVIVSMITPYKSMRRQAQKRVPNLMRVFLDAPMEERAKRPNFRASDIEFQEPKEDTEFTFRTDKMNKQQIKMQIYAGMKAEGWL